MTEQQQVTAAMRRRAIKMVNNYLRTLMQSDSNNVRDGTRELLRDTMRNFGLKPEETDDPERCRRYL